MRPDSWAGAGWRFIYFSPSVLSTALAVRIERARRNPAVAAVEIMRGPAGEVGALVRAFRDSHGITEMRLL